MSRSHDVIILVGGMLPGLAGAQDLWIPPETVAFEDLLTSSDEDYNDVVVQYVTHCAVDGSGQLVRYDLRFTVAAAGAALTNSLVIGLPTNPSWVQLTRGTEVPVTLAADVAGRFVLYDSVRDAFAPAGVGYVNTVGTFDQTAKVNVIQAFYPPGLVVGGTCPLPVLAIQRPGVWIDGSTTYPSGQPLSAVLPVDWAPPLEVHPITEAYPEFLGWVSTSLGTCVPATDPNGCDYDAWTATRDPAHAFMGVVPVVPYCDDGVQNGDETGVDSGGLFCVPVIRSALRFEGYDSVDVPHDDSLNGGSNSFTVEAWVRFDTLGECMYLLKKGLTPNPSHDYWLHKNSAPADSVLWSSATGFHINAFSAVIPGAWLHIAGTYDAPTMTASIYVGGVRMEQGTTLTHPTPSTDILRIAGGGDGCGFQGVMDEVRISSIVRYTGPTFTPVESFEPDALTKALYHFDEGSGTVAGDSSGNGNDGAVLGASWTLE